MRRWSSPRTPICPNQIWRGLDSEDLLQRIAFGIVGDRSFEDENEGIDAALGREVKARQKLVAIFNGQKRAMEIDLGNPGHAAEDDIFEARLSGCGHGNGVGIPS